MKLVNPFSTFKIVLEISQENNFDSFPNKFYIPYSSQHPTYASIVGTANWPRWVSKAPGARGSSTYVRKLAGMPVVLLILGSRIS